MLLEKAPPISHMHFNPICFVLLYLGEFLLTLFVPSFFLHFSSSLLCFYFKANFTQIVLFQNLFPQTVFFPNYRA